MTASEEFEAAWAQLSRMVNHQATVKQIAELFFLKGRAVGAGHGMKPLSEVGISPEDEAKLAAVTISERFNHSHLERVLEAQKQTS